MSPAFYAASRVVVTAILRIAWRLRVVDAHHIPRAGPVIIACNHVSYLDPPALGAATPRPLAYMAKRELFDIPVLGTMIAWLGAFPVDRKRSDITAVRAAVRVLASGACLGIFPEGTRNTSGDIQAQLGVGLLAALSGATVVPAYVSGTSQAKRLSRITVTFGEPMRFTGSRKASRHDLANWTKELMVRIYALRENVRDH
ncbi:MAG: 1-acyl-sn-glycerol-3-phosphate acyltransferase [Candidatus Eremiobacteraeota bacterium]|nr:1-acyl-sn-glycerol-3-phosphate acyltransferase [Candidatus Eremiobacteraeota bacterium]